MQLLLAIGAMFAPHRSKTESHIAVNYATLTCVSVAIQDATNQQWMD